MGTSILKIVSYAETDEWRPILRKLLACCSLFPSSEADIAQTRIKIVKRI